MYYGAALTEAISCRDEDVFVIGGANSAGQGAIHFAQYARKVTMLVRAESLAKGMSRYLVDQIEATPNIEVITHTEVVEALGGEHLESLKIRNEETGITQTIPASAVFIFIGAKPRTDWLADLIAMDNRGFIYTGSDLPKAEGSSLPKGWKLDRQPFLLETNVPGIFAAGDVIHGSLNALHRL